MAGFDRDEFAEGGPGGGWESIIEEGRKRPELKAQYIFGSRILLGGGHAIASAHPQSAMPTRPSTVIMVAVKNAISRWRPSLSAKTSA